MYIKLIAHIKTSNIYTHAHNVQVRPPYKTNKKTITENHLQSNPLSTNLFGPC